MISSPSSSDACPAYGTTVLMYVPVQPLIALALMFPIWIDGIGASQTAYPFFYGWLAYRRTTRWLYRCWYSPS